MTHGFDLDSPLVCEGIIGDGCGGGRIFFIEDTCLNVYDPTTQESMILCENIPDAIAIDKSGCSIFIACQNEKIEFDLSSMKKI